MTSHRTIWLAACGGILLFWMIDGLLDHLFFYEGDFPSLTLFNLPAHEIYTRLFVGLLFIGFALICIRIVQNNIDRLRATSDALAASEAKFRSYIEHSPDAVMTVDPAGRVVEANPAAQRLTGYSREELLRISIADLGDERSLDEIRKRFVAIPEDGTFSSDARLVRKCGDRRWITIDAARLPDGNLIGFCKEITARHRMERRLKYLNALLRGSAALKRLISHETDPVRLIDDACDILVTGMGYLGVAILHTDGLDRVRHLAGSGLLRAAGERWRGVSVGEMPDLARTAVTRAGIHEVDSRDPALSELPEIAASGDCKGYAARLVYDGETFGAMVLLFSRRRRPGAAAEMFDEIRRDIAFGLRRIESEARLKRIEWLLEEHPSQHPPPESCVVTPGGELNRLNTDREILDAVGETMLREIVHDYLALLETSAAVYEKNGDYAIDICSSGWCRFLYAASRRLCQTDDNGAALRGGEWHCHVSCWEQASRPSIESNGPVDIECLGGIRIYAVPIRAGGEVVGSINFGYGDPPRNPKSLARIADIYGVDVAELRRLADAYESRPRFIIDLAKQRLHASARLIGEIVERKRAEAALRDSEALLRGAFHYSAIGMMLSDTGGNIIEANPAACRMLGYACAELKGMNYRRITHPDDVEPSRREFETFLEEGTTGYQIEKRYLRKDGSTFHGLLNLSVVRNDDGSPRFIIGQVRDISDRKASEAALRLSVARFETILYSLVQKSPIGIGIADGSGALIEVNPAICDIVGYPAERLLGRNVGEMTHPDDFAVEERYIREIQAGERDAYRMEKRYLRADGREIWVDIATTAVRDEFGGLLYGFAFIQDISERRRTEHLLRRQHRLAVELSEISEMKPAMARLLAASLELEEIDCGAIYLFNPKTGVLALYCGIGISERFEAAVADFGKDSNLVRMVQKGEPVYGTFEALFPEAAEALTFEGINMGGAVAVIPILHEGRLVAALSLGSRTPNYPNYPNDPNYNDAFSSFTRSAVEAISVQAGGVIARVTAAREIHSQRKLLDGILNALQDMILVLDRDHNIVHSNWKGHEYLLDGLNQLSGQCFRIIMDRKVPCNGCHLDEVFVSGNVVTCERTNEMDGRTREISVCPIFDDDGKVVLAVEHLRDISDRKAAEAALRESERRLSTLMDNLPGMAYRCRIRPDWPMTFISDGCRELTGYDPDVLLSEDGPHYGDLIHPDDRDVVWDIVQSALADRAPFETEYRIITRDGTQKWVWEKGSGVFDMCGDMCGDMGGDAEGRPLYLEGFITDITGRMVAEQSMRDYLSFQSVLGAMRGLPSNQTDAGLIRAFLGELVAHYGFALAWFGYHRDGVIRPAFSVGEKEGYPNNLVLKTDGNRGADRRCPISRAVLENRPFGHDDLTAEGDFCPWRDHALALGYRSNLALPLRTAEGVVGGIMVYSREKNDFNPRRVAGLLQLMAKLGGLIDERNRARNWERELQRLAIAVENAGDAVVITDPKGRIEYVNAAFESVCKLDRTALLGKHIFRVGTNQGDRATVREIVRTLREKASWRGAMTYRNVNGEVFEEEVSISPIIGSDNQLTGYVAVKHDVTDKARLAAQLRQAQKMEAIGTLAGGIAHDFNNILFPIIGYTEMIQQDLPPEQIAYQSCAQILKAADRARDLVQQILTFSRQTEQERKPLRVQQIVKEALKLLRPSVPTTIEFRLKIDDRCPPVNADPTQIHQIVMNLCTNAYHAMRERGGVLELTLDQHHPDPSRSADAPVRLMRAGGGELDPSVKTYVRLTVSDTGTGIPPEILDRIFDPYFTTKTKDEGTGLGLSVVHGIVKGYGGDIRVESEVNRGTVFTVYLPGIEVREVSPAPAERMAPAGGSERILLVDDEATIVEMLAQGLKRLGYAVTPETDSEKALATFMEAPSRFDLLLTDMTMPRMTGVQLAERLRALVPDLKVIICSGFSEQIDEESAEALGVDGFIMKPLILKDLAATLRAVLDNDASDGTISPDKGL